MRVKGKLLKNKVIRNASWLIGCKIAQSIFALLISMLTARYLGPTKYGLINYAASIVAFAVPIMQLGLSNILVQETVEYPEETGKIFGTSILLSFCASFVCIIGIFSFVSIVNYGQTDTIVVCILYSILLIFQALDLIQYWFQAKYLSKYIAVTTLCAYIVVSVYKIYLLIAGKGVYWFAVSNAIDYMLIAFGLLVAYKKLGGPKLSVSFSVARRMLASSRYYIVSSLMVTMFAQTDKVMITLMIDETSNGYYSAAIYCASIFSFVFSAIIDSMRPKIFESRKKSIQAFELNMCRLYCIVIYLSLAQCLGMTIFARIVIYLVYGIAYFPAIEVLQLVVWYTTFSYLGAIRNIWILAEGKQRYLWIINLSGAVSNIVLNALLIPVWGIMGAAFASLVTQIFTNVIIGLIIKPIRKNNKLMMKGLNPFILR